jgi:hypothetical protein
MKVARKFDVNVKYDEPTALAINREAHGNLAVRGTQGTGEWFTPLGHIKLARAVLGVIDPATTPFQLTFQPPSNWLRQLPTGRGKCR